MGVFFVRTSQMFFSLSQYAALYLRGLLGRGVSLAWFFHSAQGLVAQHFCRAFSAAIVSIYVAFFFLAYVTHGGRNERHSAVSRSSADIFFFVAVFGGGAKTRPSPGGEPPCRWNGVGYDVVSSLGEKQTPTNRCACCYSCCISVGVVSVFKKPVPISVPLCMCPYRTHPMHKG